jgi:hypothetical protein
VPQKLVQRAGGVERRGAGRRDAGDQHTATRKMLLPACETAGLALFGGNATIFLWLADPDGHAAVPWEEAVLLAPGEIFGPEGAGYACLPPVPPLEVFAAAAQLISRSLLGLGGSGSPAFWLRIWGCCPRFVARLRPLGGTYEYDAIAGWRRRPQGPAKAGRS